MFGISTSCGIYATLVFSAFRIAEAGIDLGFGNDNDLTSFVTRPEIKVPKFEVSVYHADKVTPGYWFVGPYASIFQESQASSYYQACQTGPAIYDQTGELIWSGACRFQNQNSLDLRAWRANGSDFLSTILWMWDDVEDKKGHGVILNSSFEVISEIHVPRTTPYLNMHELNVIDDGKRALYITPRTRVVDFESYGLDLDLDVGLIQDQGFQELDLDSGEIMFEWWASDHIALNESTSPPENIEGPWPSGWNWLHINSVDKSPEGDYMISARYTNAIYKISGKDGRLIWTLGGPNSSFTLEENFNFSRQHDARFLASTSDTETITFMDNGGDGKYNTSSFSSSLVVMLDKKRSSANVTQRWIRPGHEQTEARGNFQLLPNGNAFTAWSENCVISEHSWDGELLMEASFQSQRFVTYRTWKSNFTAAPTRPVDVKAFMYGTDPQTSVTAIYVSWNGATEVSYWRFYRVTEGELAILGERKKTGFETMFQTVGFERHVLVEAIAVDGITALGRSEVCQTVVAGEAASRPGEDLSYHSHENDAHNLRDGHTDEQARTLLSSESKAKDHGHYELPAHRSEL